LLPLAVRSEDRVRALTIEQHVEACPRRRVPRDGRPNRGAFRIEWNKDRRQQVHA